MFSKKKTECRVCGYRFTPKRENIYTAEEPRSMADMLTKPPTASGGILLFHGRRAAQSLHNGMEKYGLLRLDA